MGFSPAPQILYFLSYVVSIETLHPNKDCAIKTNLNQSFLAYQGEKMN